MYFLPFHTGISMMMCQYEKELQLPFYLVYITKAASGEEIKMFIISCISVTITWRESLKMSENGAYHLTQSPLYHIAGINSV